MGLPLVFGCSSQDSTSTTTQPEQGIHDGHGDHDHAGHDHGDDSGKTDMEKMNESLASFSDDDRASAMQQHFCPVTGEMLGTMGSPGKVDISGQSVWICCDGCKEELLANPDQYLAKLNK